MTKKHYKFLFSLILAVAVTFGLSVSLQTLLATWDAPSADPPAGNVSRPIWASSTASGIQRIEDNLVVEKDLYANYMETVGNFVVGNELCLGAECQSNWGEYGDNLGDHMATQNIKLINDGTTGPARMNWLSGDGGNEGVAVTADGRVGIGTSTPKTALVVSGFDNTLSVIGHGYARIRMGNTAGTDNYKNWEFNSSGGGLYLINKTDDWSSNFWPNIMFGRGPEVLVLPGFRPSPE